ncbi:MAG: porphobilinogen synthase [Opitutales bacterium]|nr:porphobilinogen synthase [Opitutales bacterium]
MNENFKLDMKKRPRRLRRSAAMLSLCAETEVQPSSLILPVFVKEGRGGADKIPSMPGVYRHSIDSLLRLCERALKCGVRAIAPFPQVGADGKSPRADEALNPKSLANRAIAAVKKRFPEMAVAADIALDPYTSHGHDGILDASGEWILNDETVEILAAMAIIAAQSGADIVAPSDMMDGRVGAIRDALDDCDMVDTSIMAYSAKYASALYGPFRDAIGSSPKGGKKKYLDKKGYQLNPQNAREALREAALDEDEGADIIMVKPAGQYLDIVAKIRERTNLPVAAYQVSGEYSMICAACDKGWLDREKTVAESLVSIKRAGADIILTYFALEFAERAR